jgi:hypothetical protein
MRFLVQQGRQPRVVKSYPTAVLGTDNWDDYGFKTMFHARLHLGPNEVIDLETVKIMHRGQIGGRTELFDLLGWYAEVVAVAFRPLHRDREQCARIRCQLAQAIGTVYDQ